jgi:hypothetical protein
MDESAQRPLNLAEELARLAPAKLPMDVFNQVARLTVTPVVEIVPYFVDGIGQAKVLLLQRAPDDPQWPGMYHIPGSIVLATDQPDSFSDALSRIMTSKLAPYQPLEPVFVDVQLCQVSRGMEVAIIYAAELRESPAETALFNQQDLPASLIECQQGFIDLAFTKLSTAP